MRHSPCAPTLAESREGVGQIDEAREPPVAHDHLVQVDAGVEVAEPRRERGRDRRHAHRRRELDFRNRDAGAAQAAERGDRLLVFDGAMADVVADAEMATQHRLGLTGAEPGKLGEARERRRPEKRVLEEGERLLDGLQEAAGLGLERERDALARPALDHDEVRGSLKEMVDEGGDRLRLASDRLEAARHRRDAAEAAGRQKRRQDVGGVAREATRSPVRQSGS